MREPQSLVEALTADEMTVGTTLKSASPNVAEALGYTPLDFLFIDRQHGPPIQETLENVVRAADLNDLPVIVRVPKDATEMITYLLDFGVRGIVLPQIDGPEAVLEASSHVRYRDGRSLATTTRAARFGETDRDRYLEYANDDLALIPMIETEAALENVGEIAALEETSALVVGPADLSAAIGAEHGTAEFEAALNQIFTEAAKHDCAAGIFVSSIDDVERFSDRASFTVFTSDIGVLREFYEEMLGE